MLPIPDKRVVSGVNIESQRPKGGELQGMIETLSNDLGIHPDEVREAGQVESVEEFKRITSVITLHVHSQMNIDEIRPGPTTITAILPCYQSGAQLTFPSGKHRRRW